METVTLTRMTAKDPFEKIARKRMSVLQLAESLGNVSEACRRGGMDRTSFYAWQKRFKEQGLKCLKDLPPVHLTHPQTYTTRSRRKDSGALPSASWLGLC